MSGLLYFELSSGHFEKAAQLLTLSLSISEHGRNQHFIMQKVNTGVRNFAGGAVVYVFTSL